MERKNIQEKKWCTMTQSHGNWQRGSNKRLNSEIAKSQIQTTKETIISQGSSPSVENNVKFCQVCGNSLSECIGHNDSGPIMGADIAHPKAEKTVIQKPIKVKPIGIAMGNNKCYQCKEKLDYAIVYEEKDYCVACHTSNLLNQKKEVQVQLPKELIFDFENKQVKFISEEKLREVFSKVGKKYDGIVFSIDNIFQELRL